MLLLMKSTLAKNKRRSKEPMIGTGLRKLIDMSVRQAWRLVVGVVGGTVILIGIVMIVMPGPAMIVIPIGLGILAMEFVWARRLLRRIKVTTKWKMRRFNRSKSGNQTSEGQ
jgi:uncharacterized protein (TIGR02611 family)